MTRHSRNSTANAVYTYHEQKRDSKTGSYGTLKLRCGKESIKDFDCCTLSLQPCQDPVITPDGYLFDKKVILEFIIAKKKEIKEKLLEYERQKIEYEKIADSVQQATKRKKFEKMENDILPQKKISKDISISENIHSPYAKTIAPLSSQFVHINLATPRNKLDDTDSDVPGDGSVQKNLSSFWVPSLTPASGDPRTSTTPHDSTRLILPPKPVRDVICPFSGRVLTLKDLVPVKWTKKLSAAATTGSTGSSGRYDYVCAVTGDVINNAIPCAVLRTSGHVVTLDCMERVIKKDWVDPTNGAALTPRDIIPIRRGGTGFAQVSGNALEAKIQKPVLHA